MMVAESALMIMAGREIHLDRLDLPRVLVCYGIPDGGGVLESRPD